jgi:hypothetical protein
MEIKIIDLSTPQTRDSQKKRYGSGEGFSDAVRVSFKVATTVATFFHL